MTAHSRQCGLCRRGERPYGSAMLQTSPKRAVLTDAAESARSESRRSRLAASCTYWCLPLPSGLVSDCISLPHFSRRSLSVSVLSRSSLSRLCSAGRSRALKASSDRSGQQQQGDRDEREQWQRHRSAATHLSDAATGNRSHVRVRFDNPLLRLKCRAKADPLHWFDTFFDSAPPAHSQPDLLHNSAKKRSPRRTQSGSSSAALLSAVLADFSADDRT